jgi:hypothetical protein
MVINEKNIETSFRRVKQDILSLQAHLLEISSKQAELLEMMDNFSSRKNNSNEKSLEKHCPTPRKKVYVASKTGKSFHVQECPFAKNIKPKSLIRFKTKDAALNKGLKACECVKKV